jgi:hypothetical protein
MQYGFLVAHCRGLPGNDERIAVNPAYPSFAVASQTREQKIKEFLEELLYAMFMRCD